MKVTVPQLQEQLPALLDHTVQSGEECIVQRRGKDYAVLVSARAWRQRTLGRRLDALGPAYRLAKKKQERVETLLTKRQEQPEPSHTLPPIRRTTKKTTPSVLRRNQKIALTTMRLDFLFIFFHLVRPGSITRSVEEVERDEHSET